MQCCGCCYVAFSCVLQYKSPELNLFSLCVFVCPLLTWLVRLSFMFFFLFFWSWLLLQ